MSEKGKEIVRTRQRPPADVDTKPPENWPNGCVLRDRNNVILGLTFREKDGSYRVFKLQPIFVGKAPNHMEAHSLLTK